MYEKLQGKKQYGITNCNFNSLFSSSSTNYGLCHSRYFLGIFCIIRLQVAPQKKLFPATQILRFGRIAFQKVMYARHCLAVTKRLLRLPFHNEVPAHIHACFIGVRLGVDCNPHRKKGLSFSIFQ